MVTPFWQSKPPIYLGRARRESLHAQAPHRAGDGLVSGHRVNLLERYDYPVMRAISRTDFFLRLCNRLILPIMSMVITPRPLLHKKAAG